MSAHPKQGGSAMSSRVDLQAKVLLTKAMNPGPFPPACKMSPAQSCAKSVDPRAARRFLGGVC